MNHFEPIESPRAIAIPDIRKTVVALQKHAGVSTLLAPEKEKLVRNLIKESDGIIDSLQTNLRTDAAALLDAQQQLIGAGKPPADVYTRDEFIRECFTVVRAKKARQLEITAEVRPYAIEARDALLKLVDKVAGD